jgi:hypothetical protein
MSTAIRSLAIVTLAMAASSGAYADVHLNVDLNPFGWGAPPPVVYQPPDYYGPPPVAYYGRGHWGDEHWRGREHHRDRSHHDEGDHRH